MKKFVSRFLHPAISILVTTSPGCSIFTPVGDAITHVYENTVSYFNVYYNAKRAFSDAEDEIRAATLAGRAKSDQNQPFIVPVSAKQKLTVVIDKCSGILSLHPTSSFVDDALLLIGKSYFYQGEYVKGERKFIELADQYAASSLVLESKLWRAKTLERLGNQEQAIAISGDLAVEALNEGEDDVAAEAHFLLGTLYERRSENEKAIAHYTKVTELADDDETKADAQMKVGNLHFASGEFLKAVEEYREVPGYTYDPNMGFRAKLQAAISMRELKEFEEALEITEDLLQDARYREYVGTARLERAHILDAGGRREEALDEFRALDTSLAKTETGALASFELGSIYEKDLSDYEAARRYYGRSAEMKNSRVFEPASRKSAALARYAGFRSKLSVSDSLLATGEVNVDSMKSIVAATCFELGEVFYAELVEPDSAVHWYHKSLSLKPDSSRGPRVLFVLAELSNTYPDRGYGNSTEFYRKIVKEYPSSVYADQAREILSLPKVQKQNDPVEKLFTQAESFIEKGQHEKALSILKEVSEKFGNSPYAAKSEYTIGWLYEHRLSQPDSALLHYKRVVELHGTSAYAAAAKPRLPDSLAAPQDTVGKSPSTLPQQKKEVDDNPAQKIKDEDIRKGKTESNPKKEKE